MSHQAETGVAGLVFSVFVDEIIEKLKGVEEREVKAIEVYDVQNSEWGKKFMPNWYGTKVQIRSIIKEMQGKQTLTIEMNYGIRIIGFQYLGKVGEKSIPDVVPGETLTMRIVSHRIRDNYCRAVKLFDVDTTYEEAIELVNEKFSSILWPD